MKTNDEEPDKVVKQGDNHILTEGYNRPPQRVVPPKTPPPPSPPKPPEPKKSGN